MISIARNIIIACFIVIVASFSLVHFKLGADYKTTSENKTSLMQQVDFKGKQIEAIKNLTVLLPQLELTGGQIDKIGLPQGEQTPDIIEQIEQLLLSQKDFSVLNYQPSLSKSVKDIATGGSTTDVILGVRGDANKLGDFLQLLQSNIRPIYIKNIALTSAADGGVNSNIVDVNISAVIYNRSTATASPVVSGGGNQ